MFINEWLLLYILISVLSTQAIVNGLNGRMENAHHPVVQVFRRKEDIVVMELERDAVWMKKW